VLVDAARKVGIASPATLGEAIELLDSTPAGESETGRELRYVARSVRRILYPEVSDTEEAIVPPPASIYPGLFEAIRAGEYPTVSQQNASFLTLVIPPLAALYTDDPGVAELAAEALGRANEMNTASVIPPYVLGVLAERDGRLDDALALHEEAVSRDASCYPSRIRIGGLLAATERWKAALAVLLELEAEFPEHPAVLKPLAFAYFETGNIARAEATVARAIQLHEGDQELVLLRAKILAGEANWSQARMLVSTLDESISGRADVLALEARILFQSGGDLFQAAGLARQAMAKEPGNPAYVELAAQIQLAIGREDEATELFQRVLELEPERPSAIVSLLNLRIRDEAWEEARELLATTPEEHRGPEYYLAGYRIYRGIGDLDRALAFAESLLAYSNPELRYQIPYLEALIALGRTEEAATRIDEVLLGHDDPSARSDLYVLRARMAPSPEARLDDLRSALFENPQNLDALRAIADTYMELRDYRRAALFLKRAVALEPNDEELQAKLREAQRMGG
jgi:predicted Zn-dependent protease